MATRPVKPPAKPKQQASFAVGKRNALSKLAEADKSPKGSLDVPIAPLVHALNRHDDYVTTSSCSGRVALFESPSAGRAAGRWLLVEHRTVTAEELILALNDASAAGSSGAPGPLVTFKLEPPILHVQCRTLDAAQRLLAAATVSGFRESGIVLSTSSKVMLGIRTTANTLELPFAQGGTGRAALLVLDAYVAFLAEHAAKKFNANQRRTDALLAAFCEVDAKAGACVVCEEG